MGKITIVGLGPGGKEHITLGIYQSMKNHKKIYFRTEKHPVVQFLKDEGINFKTFDYAYDTYKNFDAVYAHIASTVLDEAKNGDVLYAVPGHPFVAEKDRKSVV